MVLQSEEHSIIMKISLRLWFLVILLICSALVIGLHLEKGVLIKSVEKNSTAYEAGLRQGMIIQSINGNEIKTVEDYRQLMNGIFPVSNITKVSLQTKEGIFVVFTKENLAIVIDTLPFTNIKTGLDLSGGARALVKPEHAISAEELDDLLAITSTRLNEFGISDVSVRGVTDLSGNNFMLVEVAGATTTDLRELVSQQGKFVAKIGNETVFIGGKADVTYVSRTGEQTGIYSCAPTDAGEYCSFRFSISLSEIAAQRHAAITCALGTDPTNAAYLDKKLDLYLDDQLVDSLFIGKDLRCSETTQIMISGSGQGVNRAEAENAALASMKKLQTVLITGSLPYKLEIVKIDSISPTLGKEFTKNLIFLAVMVFAAVSIVIFIRYRKIKLTLAVILTMFSEAFITIAFATLIKWNLDAPSIAGIIAGMGTGVNDQIVIIDEATSDQKRSLKERIRSAFFIIIGAFFTIIAAMLPLFWAGAGLLRGFALTTIIGISIGILITRPAFSEIVKNILKE